MMSILGEYLAYILFIKVRGKKRDFAFWTKKTNGVQSLDTPHLPKYMRKLMQRYD